jgi:hypothetical protein
MAKKAPIKNTTERATLIAMRAALLKAINTDPALKDLRLVVGTTTFSPDNFSFRVTGTFPDGVTKEEQRWLDYAAMAPGDWTPVGGKMRNGGILVGMTQGNKVIFERDGKKFTTKPQAAALFKDA